MRPITLFAAAAAIAIAVGAGIVLLGRPATPDVAAPTAAPSVRPGANRQPIAEPGRGPPGGAPLPLDRRPARAPGDGRGGRGASPALARGLRDVHEHRPDRPGVRVGARDGRAGRDHLRGHERNDRLRGGRRRAVRVAAFGRWHDPDPRDAGRCLCRAGRSVQRQLDALRLPEPGRHVPRRRARRDVRVHVPRRAQRAGSRAERRRLRAAPLHRPGRLGQHGRLARQLHAPACRRLRRRPSASRRTSRRPGTRCTFTLARHRSTERPAARTRPRTRQSPPRSSRRTSRVTPPSRRPIRRRSRSDP